MKIERYQVYKDSGIEWIESLPIDWKVKRLKEILSEVIYGTSEKTKESGKYEVLGMGDINEGKVSFPKKRFIDDISVELLLQKNDLLFNRTNSIALVGKVGRIKENYNNITFASYLIRLRVKDNQSSKYFWYFLNSECFLRYSRSNAIQTANQANLSSSKIRQFKIIDIPLNLQKTIANYLDTKTAQIDRKIDLLTQKATLYGNLKQSLINETVTRGLDKSVPMKDSGIEWLGEIPEHWTLNRHKDNFIFINKRCNDLKLTKVGLENIESKTGRFIDTETEFDGEGIEFVKNDILFGKLRPYLAKVYLAEFTGNAIGDIFVYRLKQNIYPKFTQYLMISSRYIDVINSSTIGAKMPRVSSSFIAELIVAMPPLPEQKAIANYLDTKTAQIDQIIQTINTQIEKLKEFRKTLINDVVTGKIKV